MAVGVVADYWQETATATGPPEGKSVGDLTLLGWTGVLVVADHWRWQQQDDGSEGEAG